MPPAAAFAPVQPPEAVQPVVPDVFHESVRVVPVLITSGCTTPSYGVVSTLFANNPTTGIDPRNPPTFTTLVTSVAVPAGPVHIIAQMLEVEPTPKGTEPLTGWVVVAPSQSPYLMVQLVVFLLVQDKVYFCASNVFIDELKKKISPEFIFKSNVGNVLATGVGVGVGVGVGLGDGLGVGDVGAETYTIIESVTPLQVMKN